MWIYDEINKKWIRKKDSLSIDDFEYLKESLEKTRLYSKCLSGATYYPVSDLNDIYDILQYKKPLNWYISYTYSITLIPSKNPSIVSLTSSNDYIKNIKEYGLTLKNLFTPNRLIKDSFNNFLYVDVCTTEELQDLNKEFTDLVIDGVKVKEGYRILVKDQKTYVTLSNSIDPDTYFKNIPYYKSPNQPIGSSETTYYYYNELNGIYKFTNRKLVREKDLYDYDNCIRYSVYVKMGNVNKDKQFHLSRMKNGYFPTDSENNPMEFKENHNWIIRNRIDYKNVLDINYYDILKHSNELYYDKFKNFTYSIPERIIGVGEFGVIINFQNDTTHLINNKYKVNLRSIDHTDGYYWICGDEGTLLKVSKVDFTIEKINLNTLSKLKSISFYNNLKGVVVGDFNTIFYTEDGGKKWNKITIDEFESFNYNKVLYYDLNKFYVGGDSGVFLEFEMNLNEWIVNKKRISKIIDIDDEYILMEDINDIIPFKTNNWGLSYSGSTQSIPTYKESLMIVTNYNNFIVYNLNNYVNHKFIYLEFPVKYNDINSILYNGNEFYFASDYIYKFDINNFNLIGTISNVIKGITGATLSYNLYANKIKNYNNNEILISGNNSILQFGTYSQPLNNIINSTFLNKLKSKLLILDYDIASKLNFFDDEQNYRLPNSLTFSGLLFTSSNSYLNIRSLPNEINWIDYLKDSEKTFKYYTSLDESNIVKISTTFSYSTQSIDNLIIYPNQITIDYNNIKNLAPRINETGHSRYISGTGPSISPPHPSIVASYSLFLYDYLMILKVPNTTQIDVGDVVYFDSNILSDVFLVNRIYNSGTYSYIYFYTNFNENILNDLVSSTFSIKLTNLNKYNSSSDLVNKFNLHPISKGYRMDYFTQSNILELNPIFTVDSAYYNLAALVEVSGNTYSMVYSDLYLKFGYKPHYDLLSYLENINPNVFNAGKEFLSMPNYYYIPGPNYPYYTGFNGLTYGNIYLDTNKGYINAPGSYWLNPSTPPENKLIFGKDLFKQWESLFIYTFVDLILHSGTYSYKTEKLLIINKYESKFNGDIGYVIEFHKPIEYPLYVNIEYITILSRRTLSQISEDLKELSNIQRPLSSIKEIQIGYTYSNYERELNFKFPTDSYCKIFLLDGDISENISAIIYTDYKNELALNIVNLEKEIKIPIISTSNYATGSNVYLYISCSEKHGLEDKDGVVLEFNGGPGSSQILNPSYFGFHTVGVIPGDEYNFFVYTPFGVNSATSGDPGFVKYVKKDPFLNYQPIDLIDLGYDRKTKISVNIEPENIKLSGYTYSLINIDKTKFRFKLIDGLNLEIINDLYPWILEAEISDAIIGMDSDMNLIWYTGTWHCGRWFGFSNNKKCRWISGTWISGDWYGGIWESKPIVNNYTSVSIKNLSNSKESIWMDGRWFDGIWQNGTWFNGRWYGGTWSNGIWYNGIWNDGKWENGYFKGGIWVSGDWEMGIFNTDNKPSYWLNGNWHGGDFENGIWYNGTWDQKNNKKSRFGVKSTNSRNSIWNGGKWINGEFHSNLNINDNGEPDVSEIHKLSIWKTGKWYNGDWYGGICYNIDFSGVWHGGILEDIQVIGLDTNNNSFDLNGIFKFNIGDQIYIIDNGVGNTFSIYGSNDSPGVYNIIYTVEDLLNNKTTIFVDKNLSQMGTYSMSYSISGYNLGLRVVSKFKDSIWKSGIWTNGIFSGGNFQGGIWYNGIFENGEWG